MDSVDEMEKYDYILPNEENECQEVFDGPFLARCINEDGVPFCTPKGDRQFFNPVVHSND